MSITKKRNVQSNSLLFLIGAELLLTVLFITALFPQFNGFAGYRMYIYIALFGVLAIITLSKMKTVTLERVSTVAIVMGGYCLGVSLLNKISLFQYSPLFYFAVSFGLPWVCLNLSIDSSNKAFDDVEAVTDSIISAVKKISVFYLIAYCAVLIFFEDNSTISHGAYFFPVILPFWLWKKTGKKDIAFLIACFAALTLSMKRGAFIAFCVAVTIHYLFSLASNTSLKKKLVSILVAILVLAIVITLFINIVESSEINILSRLLDIKTEGSSSRGLIADAVVEAFKEGTPFEKLFGRGFNAVRLNAVFKDDQASYSAHNDFLEILYDFGYLGLALYAVLLFFVLGIIFHLRKRKDPFWKLMFTTVPVFLVTSCVSHLFLYNYFYHFMILLWMIGAVRLRYLKKREGLRCAREY